MEKKISAAVGLRQLLRSLFVWSTTALLLLIIASAVLAEAETGSCVLGYISSSISFLAALAAGISVARTKRGNRLLTGLLTALILLILFLTLGLLIRGRELNPSGILSVVSFTMAGCILGCVLAGKQRRNRNASLARKGKSLTKRFT